MFYDSAQHGRITGSARFWTVVSFHRVCFALGDTMPEKSPHTDSHFTALQKVQSLAQKQPLTPVVSKHKAQVP